MVYGVVPTLFGKEPLKAVTARLGQLQAAGVDALWLAPINATDDPSDISYAVTDYRAIRPDFGTDEDLRALVRSAHARGMKVILDFVPNHTSTGHPFYLDAEARGSESPWWNFYERDEQGEATYHFDWTHLRNLDHGRPEVRRMMIDAFLHWVREFDVDGFRLDAVWSIRDRNPDFLDELVTELRREKPELVMIAEAGANDPFYESVGFDLAYDWEGIGRWSWEEAFQSLSSIDSELIRATRDSISGQRALRFVNNNDTGERFVTRHGPDISRVATVLTHTLPGVALVFTGDEVGAEYEPYEDPPPLEWNDEHGFGALHRRLAWLRRTLPALSHGAFVQMPTPAHPAVHVFARDAGEAEKALVVLNFGEATRMRVELPFSTPLGWDAITGRAVKARRIDRRVVEIELEATSALVLTPPPSACPG